MMYRVRFLSLGFRSLVLSSLIAVVPVSAVQAQTFLDSIVVVVDQEPITQSELEAHLRSLVSDLRRTNQPIPGDRELQKRGVEELIQEKLLLREAQRLGIRARTADVDNAVEQVARQNKISMSQLGEALQQQGMTIDSYRSLIRRQIEVRGVVDRMMSREVNVSDSEVDLFLTSENANKDKDQEEKELLLARILLPVPEDADDDATSKAQALAQSILDQLADGASFAAMAKQYSQGPEADQDGALGWRKGSQLPSLYTDGIKGLAPGDVSSVLAGGNGLHIIKLVDSRDASVETVEQLKIRHILIQPNGVLSDSEVEKRLQQLRDRIEGGDDFATLARAHSDDGSSRVLGGDMGWLTAQELPPGFQRVIKDMSVGEVSKPIRTGTGFHIIKIEDTRLGEITNDVLRRQAQQTIVQRKREEFFERWTRELRDEAYVEFRVAF